ncbi:MAG TPA: hypothetical protein VEI97_01695 [bacterium]|nr:hypothetical protein [bacterium]
MNRTWTGCSICLTVFLTACSAGGSSAPRTNPRKAATTAIEITSGLDPGATLERGETVVYGRVVGGTLAASQPLIMRVTDATTGFYWERDIARIEDWPGQSAVDLQSGEFIIDCTDDLRVGEGSKVVKLTANLQSGDTAVLERNVVATPQFPSFPWQRVLDARMLYGRQAMQLINSYVTWAETAPLDPNAFPNRNFDLDVLHALQDYYTSWHAEPTHAGWPAMADELRARLAEIEQQYPDTSSTEFATLMAAFAEELLQRHKRALDSFDAKLNLRGASYPGSDPPGPWVEAVDWYSNTFFHAPTPPTRTANWSCVLMTNQGTPSKMGAVGYVSAVVPNSADPASPVFSLKVEAGDTSGDGLGDSLRFVVEYQREDGSTETLEDTPPGNHLIAPLTPLIASPYWE